MAKDINILALRARDAARVLGVSQRTLWNLTSPRGPIPCVKVGPGKRQTVLYPVAALQAWLEQSSATGEASRADTEKPTHDTR